VSAAAVPEDFAGTARRVHRALGTGAQSGAVGDIRLVVDWAVGLIDAVAAGPVRVEWGHRLDPTIRDYAAFHPDDRAEVRRCRHDGQCDRPTIGGWSAVHVWRLVPTGDIPWQTGPAPEVNR
jgi:hypothetical protein